MIPSVIVRPSLDEVQEVLIAVGKTISGVSKGVSQWSAGGSKANEKVNNYIKVDLKLNLISN